MLRPLATLAARLSCAVGAPAYLDYYEREWGALLPPGTRPRDGLEPGAVAAPPPDVLRALATLLLSDDGAPAALPPLLATGARCCAWSATVVRLYTALAAEGPTSLPPLCAALGFGTAQLARLPHGVALPLFEVLAAVRPAPPPDWPAAAYILVGRTDLAAQHGLPGAPPPPAPPHASPLPVVNGGDAGPRDAAEAPVTAPEEQDGMEEMAAFVGPLRFGRDARLVETRRLLCSAKAQPIRLGAAGEGETPEQVAALQARLWAQASRTCALSLGRGAYTLATSRPLPTEVLPVPRLVLTGALPAAHNATIALDLVAAGAPADFMVWPDFHNGLAAGLRLVERGQAALTRNWVLYNRPAEASATHAGMLLAFGLAGHLSALGQVDLYRYLAMEHPPTTAALLLGLAASRRGSGNVTASRILFMHVPARHAGGGAELELSPLAQAAAVAGVGLLYSGTGHRVIAEVLLTELGSAPSAGDSQPDAREGHALAAGLALGMVVLGLGRAAPLLADLALETRLARLLSDSGAGTRASSLAGTPAAPRVGGAPDGHAPGGLGGAWAPRSMADSGNGLVQEGSGVNLGVTSPGATLALGLLFLRTNDATAAARLVIPDTHFGLDFVRPDLLLLRVLARALILWDSVQGSHAWVMAQLPPLLRDALQPGASGAGAPAAARGTVDAEGLAAAHVNVRAGACLALGLRFAGTAHAGAAAALRSHVELFLELKRRPPGSAGAVDKHTLETCLCATALALGAVMAGTGNLEAMRLLRRLRSRLDGGGGAAITHGSHMAVSMSLGFLFMGGGARSFSRAPAATAALLAAVVPPYPSSTSDQRFHLQALRHLYALATEPRLLRAVDADSGAPCYAPLVLSCGASDCGGAHEVATVAPCLVPDPAQLLQLRVTGPRHWPQLLTGEQLRAVLAAGTLPVKRRTGCLPYADDASGARSLLLRAFHLAAAAVPPPTQGRLAADEAGEPQAADAQREQLVAAFSGEAHLLSFSERMAGDAPFYRAALHACLASAAGDALPAYLALHALVADVREGGRGGGPADAPLALQLSTLRLCRAFYDGALRTRLLGADAPALLQRTFLDACASLAEQALEQASAEEVYAYFHDGAVPSRHLGAYLAHMGVPPRVTLRAGLDAALAAAAMAPEPTPLPPIVLRWTGSARLGAS
jgi:anaphase-promoting complex subunit 1